MIPEAACYAELEDSLLVQGEEEGAAATLRRLAADSSPEVAAHMERTGRLALLVALELGLKDPVLGLVVRTARLHDIGKLAIPPVVLEKPGPLSEAERSLVREHPIIGQKILERRTGLLALGPLVRATHERWDGGGYPDGLEAFQIPLPARIVAVCDAFDAMTKARAYGPPVPIGEAIEELRRGAGSQFDPRAAGALRGLLHDRIDRWANGA